MRRGIIAGNWKMHKGPADAADLAAELVHDIKSPSVDVVLAPPSVSLSAVGKVLDETPIALAAQNVHDQSSGAFTGEISADMLLEVGCTYV
ncbi:MAG: triose-phosphate isomerase, partial [Myxococcales bacterium]|nr:triose-phosphate isomerase [Myxococcales bacterium]